MPSRRDVRARRAEGLAGSEDSFARLMNERGATIGLTSSTFANASGWPNPNHRMSTRDLGILAARLIKEFPEYYGYFGQEEFGYDGRAPRYRWLPIATCAYSNGISLTGNPTVRTVITGSDGEIQ